MNTIRYKHTPSVNITRDKNNSLDYIATPNSKKIFSAIINEYQSGIRSFSLVGAYGTGKSSFLWALERNINRRNDFFFKLNGQFKSIKLFDFINIVGEYTSIINAVGRSFGLTSKTGADEVLKHIEKVEKEKRKQSRGIAIVIDEFGKFLEYASKHNPDEELYFIQQLAEFVNDTDKDVFLATTLHQGFSDYAFNLTKVQQKEWEKVKGRLKEIQFNEPVEQLLYLVSQRLAKGNSQFKKNDNFSKLFKCIERAKAFPLRDYFTEKFAHSILPFDILSASILTLSLQKYGQNERSLFSFVDSNDPMGIREFDNKRAPYFNISCVYDYLIYNFFSLLSTKYNPHYTQWSAIRNAIERAEGLFEKDAADASKIIKTIGLLNLFAAASAKIDTGFLSDYSKYSLGIAHPEKLLKELTKHKIIRYVNYNSRFILFEGTDLDIDLAIDEAGNLIERVSNVVGKLNEYFQLPYILAKASYYKTGTPRFFEFKLSEQPLTEAPEGEIDGFINLVFSTSLKDDDLLSASKNCKEAIVYGLYSNTKDIANLIFEIEKIKKVIENYSDDKVAVRELEAILQHQIKLLNHHVLGSLYAAKSPVKWYWKGKLVTVQNRNIFNKLLSQICDDVYKSTPILKSELVNKTRLSGPIGTARRNLIKMLVENWEKENIGFADNKFPPEKTIYLSILRETGIHRKQNGEFILAEPTTESIQSLWEESVSFLQAAKEEKKNLKMLVDKLSRKPFKLKMGLIDFWLPIFLFGKRDDFALFSEDGYIPTINDQVLELVAREPGDFEIKAFDIDGPKLDLFNHYRAMLNQPKEKAPTNKKFIETIRPFLTFYKSLPEYSKKTKRLQKETLRLREAIAGSKEPEKSFFIDFPNALGYNVEKLRSDKSLMSEYVTKLQASIKELRSCYDVMLGRLEKFIQKDIVGENLSFPNYKMALQKRYKKLKSHMLLPNQQVFFRRLISELDDRSSWLASISHACIGKALDSMEDEDEKKLYEKLSQMIYELDNLTEISKDDLDSTKEEIYKLEVTSFMEGIRKSLIRLPKNKQGEVSKLQNELEATLGEDRLLNIATLTKVLQKQLKNE